MSKPKFVKMPHATVDVNDREAMAALARRAMTDTVPITGPLGERGVSRADQIAWLEDQMAETKRCLEARRQAEEVWKGGTSETWRSVGCTLTKAGRNEVARREQRIAEKYRRDLAVIEALLRIVKPVSDDKLKDEENAQKATRP